MAKAILPLLLLMAWGCALTAPEGTKELLEDVNRDRAEQEQQHERFVGSPIFLKVRAYPRIEGSNIYGKHWILMKTGNKKIDLDPLLDGIN